MRCFGYFKPFQLRYLVYYQNRRERVVEEQVTKRFKV